MEYPLALAYAFSKALFPHPPHPSTITHTPPDWTRRCRSSSFCRMDAILCGKQINKYTSPTRPSQIHTQKCTRTCHIWNHNTCVNTSFNSNNTHTSTKQTTHTSVNHVCPQKKVGLDVIPDVCMATVSLVHARCMYRHCQRLRKTKLEPWTKGGKACFQGVCRY